MASGTTSIMLASPWAFNPGAAQDFCDYLKAAYPQITHVTYNNRQPSHFVVEGDRVDSQMVKYSVKLKEFVQKDIARSLKGPRITYGEKPHIREHTEDKAHISSSSSDQHILDLPAAEPSVPVTRTWKPQHGYLGTKPSSHKPLLKQIGDATNTEITLNVDTKQIEVSGQSAAQVETAIGRVFTVETALIFSSQGFNQYTHHLFLPSQITGDLLAVTYEEHPVVNIMRALSFPQDWRKMSKMTAVVSSDLPPATGEGSIMPNIPVPSRYWAHYEFVGFGEQPLYAGCPTIVARSLGSSELSRDSDPSNVSDDILMKKIEFHSPVEKATRVAEWVHHNREAKTTDCLLSYYEEIWEPQRHPTRLLQPEGKRESVPGVLTRRVKIPSQAAVNQYRVQERKSPLDFLGHWTVLQPQIHRTMGQKSSSTQVVPSSTKKQLKLEDFWGRSPSKLEAKDNVGTTQKEPTTAVRFSPIEKQLSKLSLSKYPGLTDDVNSGKLSAITRNDQRRERNCAKDAQQIKELFDGMEKCLTGAMCFPGKLKLEICFGLVLLSSFPTSELDGENHLSVDDWDDAFRASNGLRSPPFMMWSKLTSSGTDVDSIVDLKWPDSNDRKMFDKEPADVEVTYEFHCQCRDGSSFMITFDKHGNASIDRVESIAGTSAVHSPQTVWDIAVLIKCTARYRRNRSDKLDKAIDQFVGTVHVQLGRTLYIHCTEPEDGTFSVGKILLKRATRHRYLPKQTGNSLPSDIMLCITEIQQFLIGRKEHRVSSIRGRIELQNRAEWVEKKLVWFEMSIVSEVIEKLLQSNFDLAVGEQTDQWVPADLLGDEVNLADPSFNFETNPVARLVGSSGFGNMVRAGRAVLSRMEIGKMV